MERKTKTRTNAPALSVYLGDVDEATRRLAAIDHMAEHLGVSRSKLFAMVADGHLALVVPGPATPALGQVISPEQPGN